MILRIIMNRRKKIQKRRLTVLHLWVKRIWKNRMWLRRKIHHLYRILQRTPMLLNQRKKSLRPLIRNGKIMADSRDIINNRQILHISSRMDIVPLIIHIRRWISGHPVSNIRAETNNTNNTSSISSRLIRSLRNRSINGTLLIMRI